MDAILPLPLLWHKMNSFDIISLNISYFHKKDKGNHFTFFKKITQDYVAKQYPGF